MGKLNNKQLEYARSLCLGRDGYLCVICGKPLKDLEGVAHVDHKDGNRDNNPIDGSNWQLACHSCNTIKWHRQKMEVILDGGSPDGSSLTLTVGSKMEYRWVKWLYAKLLQKKRVHIDYAKNTGALEIEGSPETVKRYIAKHVTDSNHPKAVFRKVFIDYDTFIKFSKHVEESFEANRDLE